MTPIADKLTAARGRSDVAPEAALELVVALTTDSDDQVRAEARRTLSAWPAETLQPLLRRASTSAQALGYFLIPENFRLQLLEDVLANRHCPQQALAELATLADLDTVKIMLENIDRLRTPALTALKSNSSYLEMNQSRLAAREEGFLFELSFLELMIAEAQLEDERKQATALSDEEITKLDERIVEAEAKGDEQRKKESIYAKISRMTVSQKVQLALKGNKEERGMLIRDSSKVVSRAVLGSPKVTDAEIDTFSTLKNVSDEVLRLISMSRKFMRNYGVVRNLANNPRTPIDVGMPLIARLLPQDQRGVAMNKNVPEVVRKTAMKIVKQKSQS